MSFLIGKSQNIKDVNRIIKKAASMRLPVLISGESGTGKEVVARSIFELSERKNFVPVNCGALPKDLIESELFGYKKGAFTGAFKDYSGKLRAAHNGILFLDEIGEMELTLQPRLLRVLQEGEVNSIGSIHRDKIDVKLISATNKNIEEMVENKFFREDLYYRINGIHIKIRPLRERKEDIEPLLIFFIEKYNKKMEKHIKNISKNTLNKLLQYDWPGNVRQLQSFIEKEIFFAEKDQKTLNHIPDNILNKKDNNGSFNLEKNEKYLIKKCLEHNSYNYNKSSIDLGISRATLYRKIKQYEIDKKS